MVEPLAMSQVVAARVVYPSEKNLCVLTNVKAAGYESTAVALTALLNGDLAVRLLELEAKVAKADALAAQLAEAESRADSRVWACGRVPGRCGRSASG